MAILRAGPDWRSKIIDAKRVHIIKIKMRRKKTMRRNVVIIKVNKKHLLY